MSQAANPNLIQNNPDVDSLARNPEHVTVSLQEIYEPIAEDLARVEEIFRSELKNDVPWVDQLLQHSCLLGGKRIRPVFLLLSYACAKQACTKTGDAKAGHPESQLNMAAALEMIHTATLIHDDVLDEADVRRHQPTVNSRWGNKVSLLLGDYLFTHAFHVASFSESALALRMLAASSNRVCQGEMRQNDWQGNFELNEADYLSMISEKTAELCGCRCLIGATLPGASEFRATEFESYGLNLGIAFQIIDDVLDLVGHPDRVGKTLGTYVVNQKPTLPLIHCLSTLSGSARAEFVTELSSGNFSAESLLPRLQATGSIE